jgi:hypothetical protein
MAQVTVFVDDAVLGRLPRSCAKDGVPATGWLRVEQEVGQSNRLGILWLLAFAGPLGWIVLLYLASRDRGERLVVELPYSDPAYDRYAEARQLRRRALGLGLLFGIGLLFLSAAADLAVAGFLLAIAVGVAAVVIACVAEWRMEKASVVVSLDASRRWVTLSGVHPAFAAACREQQDRRTYS